MEITCKPSLSSTASVRYKEFSQVENISIVNIGVEEWLDSIELAWPENKDPADRIILSFAMKKNIPIITSDTKIKEFYSKVLWS